MILLFDIYNECTTNREVYVPVTICIQTIFQRGYHGYIGYYVTPGLDG